MSALPKHEPEPEQPAIAGTDRDADGWALLEALRRRLDDQGAQGRKTQHQVTQLAESIGALVAEQRRRAKWANLNSFVAYVLFTVLVGTAFFVLYRSRAHELVDARDTATKEKDAAVKRAEDLSAKATAREAADANAWDVYQLLETGKRAEAQAKLAALADAPLSRMEKAVLAARAHETAVMEVDAALKGAAASFKAGRYAEVVAPLEAALVTEPTGPRSTTMRYYLGVAYAKAGDLDKAVPLLTAAVAGDVEQDDARFQLASALDRAGQYAKARAEYDRFATAHPQSGLAVFAMRRSATLARMPAVAPAASRPGASGAIAAPPSGAKATAPATKPAAPPAAKPSAPATKPSAPATKPTTPTTKPAAPPAADAPTPSPAALPPPAKPEPAPAPTESQVEPMSTSPYDTPKAEPMSLSMSPSDNGADTSKADPMSMSMSMSPYDKGADKSKPAPPKAEPPKPEAPKPDKPKTETPKPPPPDRADPGAPNLPGFIDRAPAPNPLGPPPVEREPVPAPREPPRQEPGLPPIRL